MISIWNLSTRLLNDMIESYLFVFFLKYIRWMMFFIRIYVGGGESRKLQIKQMDYIWKWKSILFSFFYCSHFFYVISEKNIDFFHFCLFDFKETMMKDIDFLTFFSQTNKRLNLMPGWYLYCDKRHSLQIIYIHSVSLNFCLQN